MALGAWLRSVSHLVPEGAGGDGGGGHCGAEAGVGQAEAGVYQEEPTLARVGNLMPSGSWQVARLSRAVPCGKWGCGTAQMPCL